MSGEIKGYAEGVYTINPLLHIVGRSPALLKIYEQINLLANLPTTVLITGDTGTGKELVAKALHYRSDSRATNPFVAVNISNVRENLLESMLFGHSKGAFTDAICRQQGLITSADKGTMFLDEIGTMELECQARILRVLEDHKVRPVGDVREYPLNVRFVAATNSDLRTAVKNGSFREDLFYRLNVFPIRLPSLSERKEDLPALVNHFLDAFSQRYEMSVPELSDEAMEKLNSHDWPGNIRELESVIERCFILCKDGKIAEEHILIDEHQPILSLARDPAQRKRA